MSARTTDPQAIRAQERHACALCLALQRLAIRRRDPMLLEAAIRLRDAHAENDAERERFAMRVRVGLRRGRRP